MDDKRKRRRSKLNLRRGKGSSSGSPARSSTPAPAPVGESRDVITSRNQDQLRLPVDRNGQTEAGASVDADNLLRRHCVDSDAEAELTVSGASSSQAPGGPGEFESWITALTQLPPEHFKLALRTVEAQLARNHELRIEQERSRVREAEAGRSHALFAWGLGAGFVVALGMIAASVVVGLQG